MTNLSFPKYLPRPWSGQVEKSDESELPEFDPNNPLCPGVARPSGVVNPKYESTFVFTNDFPALLEDVPHPEESTDPLFKTDVAKGTCRVMCFSPKSNVTVPLMETEELVKVVQVSKIGILFLKLFWPSVRKKNVLVTQRNI